MKTKLITTIMIMLFLASMLSIAFVAPVAATPDSSIVGLWHFDTVDTTVSPYTTPDSSGYGYTGYLYPSGDGPTLVTGKFGNALHFNGWSQYIEIPYAIEATTAISMEAWVKINTPLLDDADIICKWDFTGYGVIHFEVAPNLRVRMCLRKGLTDAIVDFYSTEALPANTWVHVAEVWDGSTATIYFNGVPKGSASGTGTIRHNVNMKYWIGALDLLSARFFKGDIDEVRIWNGALTPAQILQSYNLGTTNLGEATTVLKEKFLADGGVAIFTSAFHWPSGETSYPFPATGLVGLWHFDEGAGYVAYDSSGYDNDGALHNFAPPHGWVDGMFGKALSFDSTNDYIEVPDSLSLSIENEITLEAWVYVTSTPTHIRVICKPYSTSAWTSPYADYDLAILGGGGWGGYPAHSVYFALTLGGAWTWLCTPSPYLVPLNTWTHLAATYDGSNMKIYINGVERAIKSMSGTIGKSGNPLFIGTCTPVPHAVFNGIIDEVSLWNVALEHDQIEQSYAWGSLGLEARAMIVGSTAYVMDCAFRKVTPRGSVDYTATLAPNGVNVLLADDPEDYETEVWEGGANSLHLTMVLSTDEGLGFNIQNLPYG